MTQYQHRMRNQDENEDGAAGCLVLEVAQSKRSC